MATEAQDPAEMADEEETRTTTKATPAGKAPSRPATEREVPEDPDELRAELERSRAALAKVNRESAERRRRLEDLERAEEERTRAQMSETDRQKREREDAERRAREAEDRAREVETLLASERIDRAVERAAMELGFEYPQDVPKLIDRSRIDVDEETGKILGVKEAVDKLLKERPALLSVRRGGGTPQRDAAGARRPTYPDGSHVTPEDRARQQLLASGRYHRM